MYKRQVLYFANYIVTDPGDCPLAKNQILSEKEYRDMREKYEDDFKAGMGAEAVKELLDAIVEYMPSPLDKQAVTGIHPKTDEEETREPSDEPLSLIHI